MIGLMLAVSFFFAYGKEAGEWIKAKARTKKGAFLLAVVFLWGFVSLSQVSTFCILTFNRISKGRIKCLPVKNFEELHIVGCGRAPSCCGNYCFV